MSLRFFYGTMSSGKTTRLLQEAYNLRSRGFEVVLAQSAINNRDDGVQSKIGLKSETNIVFDNDTAIVDEINKFIENHPTEVFVKVLIDEAQFLTKEQVEDLFVFSVERDISVYCYGIKNDFKSLAFPGSKRLLELAELEQLDTAPCRCGKKARFNGRFNSDTGKIVSRGPETLIEGSSAKYFYDPLCPKCFLELGGKF